MQIEAAWESVVGRLVDGMPSSMEERVRVYTALLTVLPNGRLKDQVAATSESLTRYIAAQAELRFPIDKEFTLSTHVPSRGSARLGDKPKAIRL